MPFSSPIHSPGTLAPARRRRLDLRTALAAFCAVLAPSAGVLGQAAATPPATPPETTERRPLEGMTSYRGEPLKGRLRGEVSFSRQEPVAGAVVVLIRESDPGTLIVSTTDRDGTFRFEAIPEGIWNVSVVSEGAEPIEKKNIAVRSPMRAVVDIVMKKSTGKAPVPVFDLARFEQAGSAGATDGSTKGAEAGGAAAGAAAEAGGAAAGAAAASDPEAAAGAGPVAGAPSSAPGVSPAAGGSVPGMAAPSGPYVRVFDTTMKPIREARIVLRSRGPRIDPLRAVTDGEGRANVPAHAPGEYAFRVEMPGYLPVRIERLALGKTPPRIGVVLTPRPLDYPARPADLLPEEKPVPPAGFPGAKSSA